MCRTQCRRRGHGGEIFRDNLANRYEDQVNWYDAKAYVAWLSEWTGKPYRLLSEAEWEYACRAGTSSRYTFGNDVTEKDANYHEGKTSKVGSYPPNPWKLYDMHGNVWEWVEDVWHPSYQGAPGDGSAWVTGGDQDSRVLRGGSWLNVPGVLRSANRYGVDTDYRGFSIFGFRVARSLDR